jgi:hypothetical protein
MPIHTPRLCDVLLSKKAMTKDAQRRHVLLQQAEKFLFDTRTVISLHLVMSPLPEEILSQAVSDYRTPFRLCWFEQDWTDQAGEFGEDDPLRHELLRRRMRTGILIQTDETNLRGVLWFFIENDGVLLNEIPFPITFDFTPDWTPMSGAVSDILTKSFGAAPTAYNANVQTQGAFLRRFNLACAVADQEVCSELMSQLMYGQQVGHLFVCMLMILHMPKDRIMVTRDDFRDYNKSRRRLGLNKHQRSEMHVVKIRSTEEEFDEDAQRIMERFRAEQGERISSTKGEHTVRDHDRQLRSGRVIRVREHKRGNGPVRSPRAHYEPEAPRRPMTPDDLKRLGILTDL